MRRYNNIKIESNSNIKEGVRFYKNIKYRNNVSYVYFPKKMVNKYSYISLKNKLGFISNIDNKSV